MKLRYDCRVIMQEAWRIYRAALDAASRILHFGGECDDVTIADCIKHAWVAAKHDANMVRCGHRGAGFTYWEV